MLATGCWLHFQLISPWSLTPAPAPANSCGLQRLTSGTSVLPGTFPAVLLQRGVWHRLTATRRPGNGPSLVPANMHLTKVTCSMNKWEGKYVYTYYSNKVYLHLSVQMSFKIFEATVFWRILLPLHAALCWVPLPPSASPRPPKSPTSPVSLCSISRPWDRARDW